MTGLVRSREADTKSLLGVIHAMLASDKLPCECLVCKTRCRSVRDVKVDDPDFVVTIPLTVCRTCGNRAPFPKKFDAAGWTWTAYGVVAVVVAVVFALAIHPPLAIPVVGVALAIKLFARGFSARHGTRRPTATLRQLVETVAPYKALLQFAPQASVTCVLQPGIRDVVSSLEADRFAENADLRRHSVYLNSQDELQRSHVPPVVLLALVDVLHSRILQAVSEVAVQKDVVVQVAVALLPDRQLRFEIQVVTEARTASRDRIREKLDDLLDRMPAWPAAYPVIFVLRRACGTRQPELHESLLQPFAHWARLISDASDTTYSQMALRAYDIDLPDTSPAIEEMDCIAFRELVPESTGLKQVHASWLEAAGRHDEAMEIHDGLITDFPDVAAFAYDRISCLADAGQPERAAAECQKRISLDPDESEAYVGLARLQMGLGQPVEALQTAEEVLSRKKTAEHYELRAEILATMKRTDEAASAANLAIFKDGDCAPAYLLRARLHLDAERWEQALSDLAQFRRCSGDPRAFVELEAVALAAMGQIHDAEQAYRTAVDERPEDLSLRLQFSQFLARNGKLESARCECDVLITQASEFPAGYAVRAAIALELGEYAHAIDDADRALNLGIQDPQTFMVRGVAKAACGDVNEGLEDLDVCVESWPDYSPARFHRGRLYFAQQDYETAVTEFSAALEMSPEWTDSLVQRGYARLGLGLVEEARRDFEQAIQQSPECADAYSGRAIIRLMAGEKLSAAKDLNKAVRLDPGDVRSRLNRASLLMQQGEAELAREDLDEVLAMQPDLEAALQQRAHLHLHAGQFAEAKRDFDRLVGIDPTNLQSFIGRSVAAEQTGDVTRAEADDDAARQLAPFSAEELRLSRTLLTARVAFSNEQYEKAIELATEAIDEHSDAPLDAYRIRGGAYWYSEKFVEALEDYSHLIGNDEDASRHDFSAHGQILAELGEFEPALHSLERSVTIARENEDVAGLAYSLNGQGRALAGLRRYQEAEDCFTESVTLKPDNAWLHYYRGLMYLEQNQTTSALACFELAVSVQCPRLPPGKQNRARGFITKMRAASDSAE